MEVDCDIYRGTNVESIAFAGLAWTALLIGLLWVLRMWPTSWSARRIDLNPTELVRPEQLSGYLLSANLALMEGDDFNQLASALSPKRVAQVLSDHWEVTDQSSFDRVTASSFESLGDTSEFERAAFETWIQCNATGLPCAGALSQVCHFLSDVARLAEARHLNARHLKLVAWDVQQLAYLIRLGHACGYVSRNVAQSHLERLCLEVSMHHDSWAEYSISALIGIGVTRHFDSLESLQWRRLARSHRVLMSDDHGLLEYASLWSTGARQSVTPSSALFTWAEQEFADLSTGIANAASGWHPGIANISSNETLERLRG